MTDGSSLVSLSDLSATPYPQILVNTFYPVLERSLGKQMTDDCVLQNKQGMPLVEVLPFLICLGLFGFDTISNPRLECQKNQRVIRTFNSRAYSGQQLRND